MLPSVTVNPRLRLTEEKFEIKEKISGGVPNDLRQHLITSPLSRKLCTWVCVLLSMWESVFSGAQRQWQYLYPANMLSWEQEEVPGETEPISLAC